MQPAQGSHSKLPDSFYYARALVADSPALHAYQVVAPLFLTSPHIIPDCCSRVAVLRTWPAPTKSPYLALLLPLLQILPGTVMALPVGFKRASREGRAAGDRQAVQLREGGDFGEVFPVMHQMWFGGVGRIQWLVRYRRSKIHVRGLLGR